MNRHLLTSFVALLFACGDASGTEEASAPAAPTPTAAPSPAPEPTTQPAGQPVGAQGQQAAVDDAKPYAGPGAEAPPVPEGAKVFFESPKDGDTVTGPLVDDKVAVDIKMGLEGMGLRNAGKVLEGSGHHHVIINGAPLAGNLPVPADETHIHFGKSQTEATVPLSVGKHTLTLQLADGIHRSYGPGMSETIEITVEAGDGKAADKPAAAAAEK